MKVSVHLKPEILRAIALAVWAGALLMTGLLIYRVERLKHHVDEMNAHSEELVKSADDLKKSTERLDDSVHAFIQRVQEAQAAGANSARNP